MCNRPMKVLIACEFSGTVRDAFAARGHDAWSCDIQPTIKPGNHFQCDVREIIREGWDLMIAHPPCQFLSYAGTAHWNKPGRAEARAKAMVFFMDMVNAPIPRICVENPQGWPCQVYRKPDQVIHPWMFGDPAMKRTCIWLKNLPHLWYGLPGDLWGGMSSVQPPPALSIDRSGKHRHWTDSAVRDPRDRSVTFPSIASAMAEQWG